MRYGHDFATGKRVDFSNPEEIVRQEYEKVLIESYGYLKNELDIEVKIPRGSAYFKDRADIVIYNDVNSRDPAENIIGIVEVKKQTRNDGLEQLKSYMTATSAIWGVWTNGNNISYLSREGPKIVSGKINNIPTRGQSITDVGRFDKSDLKPFTQSELKSAFRRILNTLYANTNIGRREKLGSEMTKIIFSKLQDEKTYSERPPNFRVEYGEKPQNVAKRINELFKSVRDELKHDGVFSGHERITLDPKSVAWVVGQLERGSLLDTDSDVVGDAFEVFSESKFIGEKGEFFTPRGVVKIAVKLTNPEPKTTVCDPACGSGGFLIHAMKHVWSRMEKSPEWRNVRNIRDQQKEMAARSFYGIDKEIDLVKISKAHMAIAGDGRSNIVHENSLHKTSVFQGESEKNFVEDEAFRQFDIVLTNPPFGTKTKVLASETADFQLGKKWLKNKKTGRWYSNSIPTDRDPYVLFIERCIDFIKEGGKLAIVLPESVFHAPSLGYVRQYILEKNNITAIVDLPHNTFRPHCNAKTCLIVLEKGKQQQDTIIMATPEEMGHDHTGRILKRPNSEDLWDDLAVVLKEIEDPDSPENQHVFTLSWNEIYPDVLVPRVYRGIRNRPEIPSKCFGVSLGNLVDKGVLGAWDGHGSPRSQEKGQGKVPYIRVSDIVNWEMYRNPVSGIPKDEYLRVLGNNGIKPEAGDIIFVRRGSYRIGTVAMASPKDSTVLLTKELLTLRVSDDQNVYGITPYYLLAIISSTIVQKQIPNLVCVDTTLPNIGDRWKYLVLPVHSNQEDIDRISSKVKSSILEKWSAQERIDKLRNELGGVTT